MIGLGSDENMNYELAVLTIEAVKSKKELRASVRFRPSLQNTGMSMTMIVSIMTMALAQIPISTFFPYMGFCVSIWDNVRHHCHLHHHHHHIQKSKSINTEACLIAH